MPLTEFCTFDGWNRAIASNTLRAFIRRLSIGSTRQIHLQAALMSVLLLTSLFAATPPSAYSQEPLAVEKALALPSDFRGAASLNGYIQAATNVPNDVTLSDMLTTRAGDFRPISGHDFNLGFVRTSGWMRFAIRRLEGETGPSQNVLLSLLPNMTNFVDVYVASDKPSLTAADFTKFEMGEHAPLLKTTYNGLDNVLPLHLATNETLVIYVRAANIDSTLNLSATLYSPQGYTERVLTSSLYVGLWLGGMAILIVVQLVFFCLDPRPVYGLLALYIFFTTMVYFAGLGLSRLVLFPSGGSGNDLFIGAADWLGLCTGALCLTSILELRRRFPRLDILYKLAAASGLVGVGLVLAGHNHWFTPVAGPTIFVITTVAMIVAARDFRHLRHAEEGLKFAAFFLLWAGLLLTNGQRYGVVPLPNWVAKSYGTTSIIYFILLTGSLAIRLRKAEAASREANRRAVSAAHSAERWANDLVVQRTAELVEAKSLAESALQSELDAQAQQVRFMEVISHQYRTPLAVIRSNIESVRFTLPDEDGANFERLQRADQGIARLVEVVEVNLARSQLQGSSFDPVLAPIDPKALVETSVLRSRDLLPGADIQLRLDQALVGAIIAADSDMLSLAIINLIENAVKFSQPGTRPLVEVSLERQTDRVAIDIRDYGIGIPAAEMDAVRTHAVRGSNAPHIEGTGVGLSLVSRITTAHSGTFTLAAASGGGTVASISLPVVSS